VVFLQYHLHAAGGDPLTSPAGVDRFRYYEGEGVPTMFADGKATAAMGGFESHAQDRYDKLRTLVGRALEEKQEAFIKLQAKRRGSKIDIEARVSGVKEPGENVRLRFVLVEDVVRYVGSNGQRLHRNVVRDFPGGAAGVKVEEEEGIFKSTVDVAEVRRKLGKYLSDFAAKNPTRKFANPSRPLELKKLKVVVFIQDDETRRVLQTAVLDVAPN
jgi:hypothetical protein